MAIREAGHLTPAMHTRSEYKGNHFCIELLVLDDQSCPVGDFLDALSESDRRKIDVLFERLATHGSISNKEKFKKIEGTTKLFEFKSYQIRLICFFASNKRVVICHALIKKKDKHSPKDLEHAEGLRCALGDR